VTEITIDQLIDRLRAYIKQNYKTQRAFAKAMHSSDAYVSAVLRGKCAFPIAWAVLLDAKIETRISVNDWTQRMERQSPAPVRGMKCLACGEYHHGLAGLPCPTMTPVAYGFDDGVADHD